MFASIFISNSRWEHVRRLSGLTVFRDANLQLILLITIASLAGIVLIAPALPEIRIALGVSEEDIGLIIAVYTFPAAFLAPIFGSIADRYGRREILVPNLVLFGVAGTLCAYAETFPIFIVLRALQGVGVAAMWPLMPVLIGDLFKGQRQVDAMGAEFITTNMAVATLSPAAGLLAAYSWRYPLFFYILTVPIAIVTFLKLDTPKPKRISGSSPLSYVMTTLRLLCNRGIVGTFLMGITRSTLLYGPYLTFIILWLVFQFDASPFVRGLLLAFMQLVGAFFASRGRWLDTHIGRRRLPPLGLLLYAIALGAILFATSLTEVFLLIAIFGAGHGILLPHIYNYLNEVIPMEHRAGVISIFNTFFYGGQTLGPILFGFIFLYFGNFFSVFFISSLMALVVAIVGSLLLRSAGKVVSNTNSA